jgi:uncharacterized protein (TIGR03663 family)
VALAPEVTRGFTRRVTDPAVAPARDDADRFRTPPSPTDRIPWLRDGDAVARGVALVAAVGLALRLFALGARVAHYDEGRVAYFTAYYMHTGDFEYRSIIHGPLLQHVNTGLFSVLGPTDFAARLFVALAGAALPLTALLLRDRLRDTEVVALALFLSLNPVLLYYSRFSRSTILVAGAMFGAFALFVRALDAGDVRHVYGGVFLAALGFGAKENAVLYVLCWLGAGALVADRALFGPGEFDGGLDRLRAVGRSVRSRVGTHAARYGGHAVLLAGLFASALVVLYAPRGAGSPVVVDGRPVGLYGLASHPGALPDVLSATVDDVGKIADWVAKPGRENGESVRLSALFDRYARFFGGTVKTYVGYALPLVGFGVAGFVVERYAASRPRPLVMFAGYWAAASAVGYPLGTDIYGAWIVVNVLVPLAVPAAVGLASLYRVGTDALAGGDRASAVLVGVLLLAAVGQVGMATAGGVYLDDDGADGLVQYAQPGDGMRVATDAMRRAAGDDAGPDVLVYGEYYVDNEDDFTLRGDNDIRVPLHPQCTRFFPSLSLPWYQYKDDVAVVCAENRTQFETRVGSDPPPVVYGRARTEPFLDGALGPEYEKSRFFLRTDAGDRKETVVYVRRGT